MRVARLHGPADLRIEDAPLPCAQAGELVIEIEVALAGGTARKVFRRGYHARMGKAPLSLGHEGVGRVVQVGAGLTIWKVGQRILPSNSAACGTCACCERGLSAQCEDMTWLTGMLATHALVPAPIVAGNTFVVPDALPSTTAALAENLACVLKGKDRTPVRKGERVVVLGAGPMGRLWVWALAQDGAEVVAVARNPGSLDRALAMGATQGVLSTDRAALLDASGQADLIVEAVGSVEAWALALDLARPGARVHFFGGPKQGTDLAVDTQRLHYDELTLTASFHHTPFHFASALRLLTEHGPALAPIIDRELTLDGLPAWMAEAHAGGKVAIQP